MGVTGLTTFLDNNPFLLTDKKLQGGRVLIDGNNLFYFIQAHYSVDHQYSGDYDEFASHTKFFFETLLRCDVQPFVIFDAVCESKKLASKLKRTKDMIMKSVRKRTMKKMLILPLLCPDVFRRVLCQLGVAYAVCDFEADEQIAALAQKWECPVLTNDSDFFVYPLPAGVILLDYLNLEMHESDKGSYLCVQLFNVSHFLDKLGIDQHQWALFASLKGNDYINPSKLEPFLSSLGSKRVLPLHLKSRNSNLISLLSFVLGTRSFEDALERILCKFKREKRPALQSLIMLSVNTYMQHQTQLDEYFDSKSYVSSLRSFNHHPVPDWLVSAMRCGDVPSLIFDALVNRKVILTPLLEELSCECCHNITTNIRSLTYSIITSIDEDETKIITEHVRNGKNLQMIQLSVISVTSVHDIPALDSIVRENMILDVLELRKEPLDIIDDLKLFTAAIIYWCKHASVTKNLLISVLASAVKLHRNDTWTDYKLKLQPTFDSNIVHCLNQLNVCLRDISALNGVLLKPWKPADYSRLLRASCIVALHQDLLQRSDPVNFVMQLFSTETDSCELLSDLIATVTSVVGEFKRQCKDHKVSAKKCRQRMKSTEVFSRSETTDSHSSSSSESDEENSTCDINNQFYQLSI